MPPDRDTDETEDGVVSDAATERDSDPEGSADTGTHVAESDEGTTAEATTATVGSAEVTGLGGDSPGIEPLDRLLPALTPDSRWWYWIAAVPVYFVLSMLLAFGGFLFVVVGVALDIPFGLFILVAIAFVLIGLPGAVLSVMFPLAIYADARAIAGADIEWTPDPILYGLLALAAVLITAFVLSVPLALYYLYQRHHHVGTP